MKTCIKCGFYGDAVLFIKNGNICKECCKAYNKAYIEKNKDKVKARMKAYREKNKDKVKATEKAYREKNKDKIECYNKYKVEHIKDSYVASMLKIPTSEAPPELLELKRDQIKIHRLLKEVKNGTT